MALGQINPLNFLVAQRLAANQNVDASTATRHALVGTLLGEGILGPIIARQLAIRDAATAPAPVADVVSQSSSTDDNQLEKFSTDLRVFFEAQSNKDKEDIEQGEKRIEEAKKRQEKRTNDLKTLCDSLKEELNRFGGAAQAAEKKVPVEENKGKK